MLSACIKAGFHLSVSLKQFEWFSDTDQIMNRIKFIGKLLFNALVRPKLKYAPVIWYPHEDHREKMI